MAAAESAKRSAEPVSAADFPRAIPSVDFLYEAVVDIGPVRPIGRTALGERRIVEILGGTFAGPSLRGCILPGGTDRQLVDRDGVVRLHALYEMETDDGFVITVRNRVLLEESGATLTYARSHVELWAPDGPYAWLSRRIFIGTLCSLDPRPQVLIRVFQVG